MGKEFSTSLMFPQNIKCAYLEYPKLHLHGHTKGYIFSTSSGRPQPARTFGFKMNVHRISVVS